MAVRQVKGQLLIILFPLLLNCFICFVGVRYAARLFGKKLASHAVYCIVAVLGIAFFTLMNNIKAETVNFDFTAGSFIIFILMFFYPERLRFKLMTSVLFVAMASISQLLSIMLVNLIMTGEVSILLSIFPAAITFFIFCELIVKISRHKQENIGVGKSILFATIPTVSIVLVLLIFMKFVNSNGKTDLWDLVLLLGIIYINCMMFFLLGKMSDLVSAEREKELLAKQIAMQTKHYEQLESYQNEIRRIRHDMKNHLLALHQIVNDGDAKHADGYLSALLDNLQDVPKVIDTGNPSIDAILNIKLDEARQNNVSVDADILIPQGLNMAFEKSVALFGNLLDNAIEAAVLTDEKSLSIKMNAVGDALYLQITNSACTPTDRLFTTKPDAANHGFGLKNVRLAVDAYNGTMKIQQEGDMFRITIVLYGVRESSYDIQTHML